MMPCSVRALNQKLMLRYWTRRLGRTAVSTPLVVPDPSRLLTVLIQTYLY